MKKLPFPHAVAIFKKLTAVTVFYLLLFISLAAAGYLVVRSSNASSTRYNQIAQQSVQELNLLMQLRQEADAVQLASLRMIFNREPGDQEVERASIARIQESHSKHWQEYAGMSKTAVQSVLFDSLLFYRQKDQAARAFLLRRNSAGNASNTEAIEIYYTIQKPAYDAYQQAIQQLSLQVNAHIAEQLMQTDLFVTSSSDKVNGLLLLSFLMMIAGGVAISLHHQRLLHLKNELLCERQQKQAEIALQTMNAQEKERNEIGRELHDNVNQLLAVTRLNLTIMRQQPDKSGALLTKSISHLTHAAEEIRCLTRSLVSPLTNSISLRESIQELANSMQPGTRNISFVLFVDEMDEERISADIKTAIYRMLQEQLNNILKHSRATHVRIELTMCANVLQLKVTDNGIGFDLAATRRGIGINNIINRAEAFQGGVVFDTTPGKGCTVTVCLPLAITKWSSPRLLYQKIAAMWV